ncbi:hypothetical protein [Klebsiella sp. BIGb0407]|uniref:hypothetical protein n=1 Tax=Klebsiella sp. BIGb0407 TaxID=2940603 RepID=UPI002169646D|nr:hypothetical protein [Klebsiella sp. BIGb0407]MCS3431643.1 hypothetical protein [Klebsiella sp. BIGb0407]
MKIRFFTALLPLLLLAGCDRPEQKPSVQPQVAASVEPVVPEKIVIDFPALTIIENTVAQLAPKLNNQFDISVIQRICLLARGEVSKERVIESIKRDGHFDPAKIPAQDHPLSLLVNDDQEKRAEMCAAWLASWAARIPDEDEITVQKTRKIEEKGQNKGKERTVTENVLSNDKVAEVLAVKLSVLRANAEIYAFIASELEKMPGLTLEEYARAAGKTFSALSPYYLKRVQELYSPEPGSYHLTQLGTRGYAFNTDGGYYFSRDGGNALLTYRGINWLGRGDIMGKDYKIAVSYFPDTLIDMIAQVPASK